MDDVLAEIVLERLAAAQLPDSTTDLVLAAVAGDKALAGQLGAGPGDLRRPAGLPTGLRAPAGAFLRSLTVRGFRGIGPAATLELVPGPGLTLVAGRNGSGKSSFAEAAEILLTGSLKRWAPPVPAVARDSWRSKHCADAAEIRAELLIEGSGSAIAAREWPAGADLSESAAWLQRAGEKRGVLGDLGWAEVLTEYRPFLSHSELEAFFGRPSELHDLLASVLGLDDLTAASARLNGARKEREDAVAVAAAGLEPLRGRLAGLDDQRARACLAALSARAWDIPAAMSAATGAEPSGGSDADLLKRVAQLAAPPVAAAAAAAAEARRAAASLDEVVGTAAGQALVLAGLLEAALEHQRTHGDGDCPVCGRTGALTAQWRVDAVEQLARLRQEAGAAAATRAAAAAAAEQALALMQPVPAVLGRPAITGLDLTAARDAWTAWAQRPPGGDPASPAGLRGLADHLEQAAAPLATAVQDLAVSSAAELSRRDDRWAPLAADVAAWCASAGPACTAAAAVPSIKKARTWLVSAAGELRDARLAPLADQARAIWAMLRQESNVDLGAFRLAGTATQRRLELNVSIDGSPGAALGVMSQGEINALALSIFLPRATMPQSPFRFLIIDDPVQAMDPAKVDGLARVLEQVAADRQVIVFTHDNRLTAAVRDLDIQATVMEVTRQPGSVVHVRTCLDPAGQALSDASALSADQALPAGVAVRVIPGLCRTAVEAALTQAVWRQQLRAGRTRDQIGTDLAAARRLTVLAALAMYGDTSQGAKVLPRLSALGRDLAGTFQALNRGAHRPHPSDLAQLIAASRRLTAAIHDLLP